MTGQSINEPDAEVEVHDIPESINEPDYSNDLVIDYLSPSTAMAGDTPFDMTVVGTGFSPASVVYFGGNTPDVVYVDGSELTVLLDLSLLSSGGVMPVTVKDDGRTSNAVNFTITDPA